MIEKKSKVLMCSPKIGEVWQLILSHERRAKTAEQKNHAPVFMSWPPWAAAGPWPNETPVTG